jgi:uncharacterized protein YjiS (DUF1127 family)
MLSKIANRYRQHRQYRQTMVELNRLTDRELADLGIGRSEISNVARRGSAI